MPNDHLSEFERDCLQKKTKGEGLLASRERSADRRAHEQRELQAALKRDGRKCRVPACEFASKNLPIDPCHMRQPDGTKHRGMGGDPTGDSTQRMWTCSMCRRHHGMYDAGLIDAQPLTTDGYDGPVSWSRKHTETGQMLHVASETRIGVSVPRT